MSRNASVGVLTRPDRWLVALSRVSPMVLHSPLPSVKCHARHALSARSWMQPCRSSPESTLRAIDCDCDSCLLGSTTCRALPRTRGPLSRAMDGSPATVRRRGRASCATRPPLKRWTWVTRSRPPADRCLLQCVRMRGGGVALAALTEASGVGRPAAACRALTTRWPFPRLALE